MDPAGPDTTRDRTTRSRRSERVEELFGRALELDDEEREAFLASLSELAGVGDEAGGDEIRKEVSDLLAAHEAAAAYFEELGRAVQGSGPRELELATAPQLDLGPYRTVDLLGHGGMGRVYLAERRDGQFEQQVAIKLLPGGADGEQIRRFLEERQILADLDHPAIARLLDGGVTDDGRPFFVMEHVRGRPLTETCDARRLGIDERIELVCEVGEAVRHAHAKLVVHRDLKPSNILVTEDGRPKLLDFGIAKLLDHGAPAVDRTRTELRRLTPLYAAPEQATGAPVTVATDVYSLGLVLYEVLTGRRPHALAGDEPAAVERAIRELEPPPPSQVVAGDDEAARARRTTPSRLANRLRGDLDAICLQALAKDPTERYGSVEGLLADLRSHLAGHPIRARRASRAHRAAKFVRRHPIGTAAAAVIVLLLAGLTLAAIAWSVDVARERDKAEQVADLLVDLFRDADPTESLGETVTAREVLDRAVGRLDRELHDQPLVRAALLVAMGGVYQNLGLFERAEPLLEEALELRRREEGPTHPETLEAMADLADLQLEEGNPAAAEALLSELLPHAPPELEARALDHLGRAQLARGEHDAAAATFARALERDVEIWGAESLEAAATYNHQGALAMARGDYPGAEAPLGRALDIRRRLLGEGHPTVAATANNLASLYGRLGQLDEAAETLREVIAIRRHTLGSDHPGLATNLNNLGAVLLSQGDLTGAEPFFDEALDIRRRRLDADHPDLAQTLGNYGYLLHQLGRFEEAAAMQEEAIAIRHASLGDAHPLVGQGLTNLGLLRRDQGRLDDATSTLGEAASILEGALGDAHPAVATAWTNLASAHHRARDLESAEAFYRRSLDVRRAALPEGHPHLAYSLVGLGAVLADAGRTVEAIPLLEEALEIRRATAPPGGWEVAEAEGELGRAYLALGREDDATPLLASAREGLAAAGPVHRWSRERLAPVRGSSGGNGDDRRR